MLDQNIQDSLKKDKYIFFDADHKVITIFDFHFYLRNDYDHLSFSQRKHITQKLKDLNFTQKSGSIFQKNDINIFISKAINLGVSPLTYLVKDLGRYEYVVTTPTALFLLYFSKNVAIEKVEELITKCPVNLDQARDFSIYENFHQRLMENYSSLKKLQTENESLHKFKRL